MTSLEPSAEITRRNVLALAALGIMVTCTLVDAGPASAAVPFQLSNPYTRWALRDDWAAHRRRGSAGGVDYGLPAGTNVAAPAAGSLTFGSDAGRGYFARINHPGGWRSELLHLQSFGGSARQIQMNEIVGRSGGVPGTPGAGSSTGAHLHWSLFDPGGANVDPLPLINSNGTNPQEAGPEMVIIQDTGIGFYFIGPAGLKQIQNTQHLGLLQRVVNRTSLTFNAAEIDMLRGYFV